MRSPARLAQNPATANLHFIDKFRVVTQVDFNAARTTTDHADGDLIDLYDSAEGLLKAFARGSTSVPEVPEATTTWGHLLLGSPSPSPQGLSHPVGATWTTPANNSTTLRFEWPTGSDLSEDVVASNGLIAMIKRLLVKHKAALAAAATATESVVTLNALTDDGINFRETDKNHQVHVALGACKFEGGMQVKIKKGTGTALEVSEVNCWGALFDLYDWGYDAPKLTAPNGTVIGEPREAAKVQAGYAILAASTSWPSAGRVFFTKVNFGTGWTDLEETIP